MKKWNMAGIQNEKQKRATLNAYHTGIRIEETFPNIERIEIDYTKSHHSAFGSIVKEGSLVLKPKFENFFIIPCLNRECSSVGFDLSNDIFDMYRVHQNEKSGRLKCCGQEAPDHPEQSCSGTLEYTIKIEYKSKD